MKKIAVIGATGFLGHTVTKELIAAGFLITVIARNSQRAKQLFPKAIVISGDLKNKASLETALQGQDIVYLSLHVKPNEKSDAWHAETDGIENLLDAARKAGVGRIAFLSSLVMNHQGQNGFHWWVFDVKQRAVNLIKNSGIPYTIFYPSTFMENFTEGNFRMGKLVLLAGTSKHSMYFISAKDYAKQLFRAFELAEHESKEYVIQGPEAFTAEQAAHIFVNNYTKEKLRIITAPFGVLKFMGKFLRSVRYGVKIVEALNEYPEQFEAKQTWQELGKPETTLQKFAKTAQS